MLRWLWDCLFVRSIWETVDTINVTQKTVDGREFDCRIYVLRNQWGDMKRIYVGGVRA